jgi:hypothetical protein
MQPPALPHSPVPSPLSDFNLADYANSMTLTALVSLSGVEQTSGTLTGFVGTTVRGLQGTPSNPPFGPYTDKAIFLIMLFSDIEGETFRFTFFTGSATVQITETLIGETDGSIGSVIDPFLMTNNPLQPPPSAPFLGTTLISNTALCNSRDENGYVSFYENWISYNPLNQDCKAYFSGSWRLIDLQNCVDKGCVGSTSMNCVLPTPIYVSGC